MKKFGSLFLILFVPAIILSQKSQELIIDNDIGIGCNKILEDNNGDYIACGVANTPGNEKDILLAKLQPNGTPVFLYAYDVITRDNVVRMNDIARDMIIDSYGNYVIVGHTNSTDPTCDILIAKFDNAGGFLWAKTLGEPGVRDIGRAIIENSDGNYIILGYSGEFYSRDIVLAEFSPFGTLIKSVKIDGNGEDYGWDIVEDQTIRPGAGVAVIRGNDPTMPVVCCLSIHGIGSLDIRARQASRLIPR